MANIPFLNNAYFAGTVAIGTETSYTVGGTAQVTIATGSAETALAFGPSNNDMFYMRSSGSQGNFQFQTSVNSGNSGSIQLQPFGGNVGIGTTGPNALGFLETGLNIAAGSSSSTTLQQAGLVISGSSDANDQDDFGYLSFTNYQSTLSADRVAEIRIKKAGSNVDTGQFHFYTANGTNLNESMVLGETGLLKLSQYGAGTLVTDASGNITVSSGGGAGGPYLPLAGGTMTGTNGVVFPDVFKLNLGTGSDLQIVHDSFDSYINNFTGNLYIKNLADNKDIILQSDNGSGGTTAYLTLDGSITKTIASKDIHFDGTTKATFGSNATPNLSVYSDGTSSFIKEGGAGNFNIQTNGSGIFFEKTDGENMAVFRTDSDVELYYNGSKKFETTNTGISIDVNSIIPSAGNSNAGYWLYGTHAHGFVSNANGDLRILALTPGGQKEVLRSYITTASKLIIDGDNYYNVGIGTTSPTTKLHVAGTGLFTGLVSGITPVAAANFVTKAYVDGSGGGTGPFLPLAGGTMTGDLKLNDDVVAKFGTGDDLRIQHASGGGGSSFIQNYTGNLSIQQRAADKDLIFSADDGSGGVATYLTLDGGTTHAYFSNPGNVGIGATSPSYKLTAYGSGSSSQIVASFGAGVAFNEFTAIGLSGFIGSNGATKAGMALQRTNSFGVGKLHFLNNGSVDNTDMTLSDSRMVITDAGNVGIGTTSPTVKLDINGDVLIKSGEFISWGTAGVTAIEGSTVSNKIAFRTSSAERMRISSSGNVGIGTTSPDAKLKITQTGSGTNNTIITQDSARKIFIGRDSIKATDLSNNAAMLYIQQHGGHATFGGEVHIPSYIYHVGDTNTLFGFGGQDNFIINTGGGRRLTVTNTEATFENNLIVDGNVGIGTTSPSEKLEVDGSIKVNANGFFGPGGTVTTDGIVSIDGGNGTGGEAYLRLMRGGASGFILNHTATAIQVRATANIPMFFYTNDTLSLKINANNTLSLPTYGAGYLKTDGSGNVTADSTVPGTGVFLPLAGGTLTGALFGTTGSFTGLLSSVGYSGTSGTFSASVTASGNSNSFGNTTTAALTATSGTFSSSVTAAGNSNSFGTTTVTGNLTVGGSGTFASTLTVNTANSNILTLNRTTTAGGYMRFQNNGTDKLYIGSRATISGTGGTGYDIYTVGGNDIRFFSGTLLNLTLDTSQNATFAGDVIIPEYIYHAGNTSQDRFGFAGDDTFVIRTNGTDKFTADANSAILLEAGITKLQTTGTGIAVTGAATGTTATTGTDVDATLTTKGYVDGLVTGVPVYKGTWDASGTAGGTPDLRLAANKVLGNYYIVSTAGSATPNGTGTEPDSWAVGDWCIFSDVTPGVGTDLWQRIDNSSVVSGAGTGQSVTKWEGTLGAPSETLTDGPITFSGSNSTFAGEVAIATGNDLRLYRSDNATYARFNYAGASVGLDIDDLNGDGINLQQAGVNKLRIETNGNATFAGNVTVGNNGNINIPTAASGNANLNFDGTDFKITSNSSSANLKLETNSTTRLTINSSGNVNIGSNLSSEKLEVGGTIRIRVANSSSATLLLNNTDTQLSLENTGGNMIFTTAGAAERMRINSTGLVGIGTSFSQTRLQTNLAITGSYLGYLNGTASTFDMSANIATVHNSPSIGTGTAAGLVLANNDKSDGAPSPIIAFSAKSASNTYNHTYAAIYGIRTATGADTNWTKGDIVLATGQSTGPIERMRINSIGNVGIGTSGFAQKRLDISGPTGGQVLITGASDAVGTTAGIMFRSEASEENGLARVKGGIFFERIAGTYGNGKLKFAVNSSANNDTVAVSDVAITIDTNKNVGIGTTSPRHLLQVGASTLTGSGSTNTTAAFYGDYSDVYSQVGVYDNDATGIGVGGAIDFGGLPGGTSSSPYPFGKIGAFKENATVGDYAGYLQLFTTSAGSNLDFARLSINSSGSIKFDSYSSTSQTGTPTYLLGTDASGNVVKTLSTPSPITSQAASLYDLIPNGAFTTTYAFTSTAGTYAEVMSGDDVITATGTYSVQMIVNDYAVGGTQYDEKYSGVMSWHAGSTNDSGIGASSEIVLHRAGHAGNQGITYLRTRETAAAGNNELKLEIMCNRTYTGASNVIFKFVRLI